MDKKAKKKRNRKNKEEKKQISVEGNWKKLKRLKYNCRLKRERRYDIKEKRRKHKEIYQIDSFSKLEIYKVIMMKTKQARKKKKGATWFLSFQRSFLRLKERKKKRIFFLQEKHGKLFQLSYQKANNFNRKEKEKEEDIKIHKWTMNHYIITIVYIFTHKIGISYWFGTKLRIFKF